MKENILLNKSYTFAVVDGQSRADFLSNLSIAYKEARETNFRLRLLKDAGCIALKGFNSLFKNCEELLKI